LEKKEGIVAGAAVALVLYTLSLSIFGPMLAAALRNQTISNAGSVKTIGVGVYWDQNCANAVTSINWGIIEPGSNVNKTVYIRNEGNASSYMRLIWDYAGQTLTVNEITQVKFTLTVSSDITDITNFSFDITIAANG
jgi:hypothetical protein